jgi:hypothetical protein
MIRDHNLTPPRKKLPPLVKVKLAAATLAAVLSDRMSEEDAGRALREATGTQWSLLTCMQYLSGKEALGAIAALTDNWTEDGMTKEGLESATKVAAFAVANAHPKGTPLCASDLAKQYKGQAKIQ